MRAAFAATRAIFGSYEIDFRIMVGAEVRWISARGQGDDAGIADGTMFGIFLDVTGRKHAGSERTACRRDASSGEEISSPSHLG